MTGCDSAISVARPKKGAKKFSSVGSALDDEEDIDRPGTLMNNPAIKRLARELQEIQEDFINNTDRLIEAEPLKVSYCGASVCFNKTL